MTKEERVALAFIVAYLFGVWFTFGTVWNELKTDCDVNHKRICFHGEGAMFSSIGWPIYWFFSDFSEGDEVTERTRCCVPFCERTTAKPYPEWICREHWRLVPRKTRFAYYRARNKERWGAAIIIWRGIKRRVFEAAGGI